EKRNYKAIEEIATDETNGIELKELTPQYFKEKMGYGVRMYIDNIQNNQQYLSSEEFLNIQEDFENTLGDIISYFNDSNCTIKISGIDSYHSFLCEYQEEENVYKWSNYGDWIDDNNTTNNVLTKVRKLSINDTLYYDEEIEWNADIQQYQIHENDIYMFLNRLDIKYENDSNMRVVKWSNDEDSYILDMRNDVLTKNDEIILEEDASKDYIYMDLILFSEITGSNCYYDEETRTIHMER
ncbi:MAG: hypothetical protein ACK5LC_03315, partial [Coprobacillaceae bacterium]